MCKALAAGSAFETLTTQTFMATLDLRISAMMQAFTVSNKQRFMLDPSLQGLFPNLHIREVPLGLAAVMSRRN